MLRTSRVHPKLSAYSILKGIHDFNRHPCAPPGTQATISNPPETRTSFGPHAIDAWYIGPAPQHYRCYNFFLPLTGGIHTSGKATFYPQHCTVTKETPMDKTSHITASLVTAIQCLRSKEEQYPSRHTTALEKLADIFNNKPTHQKSTHPTVPPIISTAPCVHKRTTRANTPDMLPPYSRVINPPTSRVTTPPTGPAEKESYTPDFYEYPRGKRARTRVRTAPKERKKRNTDNYTRNFTHITSP